MFPPCFIRGCLGDFRVVRVFRDSVRRLPAEAGSSIVCSVTCRLKPELQPPCRLKPELQPYPPPMCANLAKGGISSGTGSRIASHWPTRSYGTPDDACQVAAKLRGGTDRCLSHSHIETTLFRKGTCGILGYGGRTKTLAKKRTLMRRFLKSALDIAPTPRISYPQHRVYFTDSILQSLFFSRTPQSDVQGGACDANTTFSDRLSAHSTAIALWSVAASAADPGDNRGTTLRPVAPASPNGVQFADETALSPSNSGTRLSAGQTPTLAAARRVDAGRNGPGAFGRPARVFATGERTTGQSRRAAGSRARQQISRPGRNRSHQLPRHHARVTTCAEAERNWGKPKQTKSIDRRHRAMVLG